MQVKELVIPFEGVYIEGMSLLNKEQIEISKFELIKVAVNGHHQACQTNAARSKSGKPTV